MHARAWDEYSSAKGGKGDGGRGGGGRAGSAREVLGLMQLSGRASQSPVRSVNMGGSAHHGV